VGTLASPLRREHPHREQAEEDCQSDPGTVTVKRAHSLAPLGKRTPAGTVAR
jgi:hypothetical protein